MLWDLDGTLADSRVYHWQAWREAMAATGRPITEQEFDESFGQRNDAILSRWLGAGTPPDRMREIGDAKEARYRELIEHAGIEPLAGARAWVQRLREAGWRQAIASSAPRENVEVMARVLALRPFMDALVSAEDVRRGKPDPEVFLAAATKVGVPAARCVVVEDAAAGIEAARRAGMRCIGVGEGATEAADHRVVSLADLPADVFDQLLG